MTSSFDVKAKSWDTPQKVERAQAVAAGIKRNLNLTKDMIGFEYGCGTGLLSVCLYPELAHITLADSSVGMLEVLQQKIQRDNLAMTPLQLDLMVDPVPTTRFDLIYTMLTLHHIDDTDRILQIFYTLLKEQGALCIADLDQENGSFHSAGFHGHNGFAQHELQNLAEQAGFRNIHFETCYSIEKEIANGTIKRFPVFLMVCNK